MKLDSLWVQRLVVGIALAVFGVAILISFYAEHERIQNRERERLLTQSRVIEQNINQNLAALDDVLKGARRQIEENRLPSDFNAYLKALTDAMPSARTMLVIDARGTVTASSRPDMLGLDFSQRAYFRNMQQHPNHETVYVSSPFLAESGIYAINISRMLAGPRGEFAGVLTTRLEPDYFAPLLDSVRYAPDMTVTLAHWDGIEFLSQPSREELREKSLLERHRLFREHRNSGNGITLLPQLRDRMTGNRMIVLRTIRPDKVRVDHPLVVIISRDIRQLYANWRNYVAILGSLYLLIFFAATLGLLNYQRRQKQADLREAEAAEAIRSSERFMKAVTDNLPAMVAYWSRDLHCRFANDAYLEWFGKTPEEMAGMRLQDLLGDELFQNNEPYIRGALRGERQQFQRTLVKADKSAGYTWAQYIPDIDGGQVKGFYVLVLDVTPLKEAQIALEESEGRLRAIIEAEPECIAILTGDGRVEQINPAGQAMIGATTQEDIAGSLHTLIAAQYRQDFDILIANAIQGHAGILTFELIGLGGLHCWLECHAVTLRERKGADIRVLCVMRDITERKRAQEELEHMARTDFLTGLANRRHFMTLGEQELLRSRRYNSPLSVLMMDIDFFKKINDTYGHKCGDEVLHRLAELCRASLRSFDIIGRLGGEEFAVLLPQTDGAHAIEVAEHLRERVAQAGTRSNHCKAVRFTISIGVASRADVTTDLETLLAAADKAMYEAKRTGRNKVCAHQPEDNMPVPS